MYNEINIEYVEELFKVRSHSSLIKEALYDIMPWRIGVKTCLFIVLIVTIPSILMALSSNTINLFLYAVSTINTVILSLFGIVFMGYAFFQALLSDDLLIWLLKDSVKSDVKLNKSKLLESNEYFAKVMFLDVGMILANIIIMFIMNGIHSERILNISYSGYSGITFVVIFSYFYFAINVIWEMNSFIYNLFQLFNCHAGAKAIEILKKNTN